MAPQDCTVLSSTCPISRVLTDVWQRVIECQGRVIVLETACALSALPPSLLTGSQHCLFWGGLWSESTDSPLLTNTHKLLPVFLWLDG